MWEAVVSAVTAIVLVYCLQLILRFCKFWRTNWHLANMFPHVEDWSYISGTFKQHDKDEHWTTTLVRLHAESTDRFKNAYSIFLGPKMLTTIILVHPEPLQAVLRTMDGKHIDYEYFREWLGDGLLLAKGTKWQRNRKLLTPAFHFGVLKAYMKIYNNAADVLLEKLANHCRSGTEYWDVIRDVNLMSLDIILQSAFSSKTNCQTDLGNDYVKAVTDLAQLWSKRLTSPWRRVDFIYNMTSEGRLARRALATVHRFSRSIIDARRKMLAERLGATVFNPDHDHHVDFLDILLTVKDTDGNPLPDEDIKAEVDTFLFEGHDTTTSALSWTLYLLAKYPKHQQRIQMEIDKLVAGRSSDCINWNDLSELKELTLFIKEAMRLFPPVPSIGRCTEKDMELCGRHVPKGSTIKVLVYALHHNRHVWGEDVEEFKPERFSLDSEDKINLYAYVPFSAGPRNCIGQNFAMNEIKVVISRILSRFSLSPHPSIQPKPVFVLILKTAPGHPIYLKLEPRA